MSDTTLNTLAPDLVDALRGLVAGRVTSPADPDWEQTRLAWDLQVDQRPSAVVHVHRVDDIVAVVRFASRHGLSVSAQPIGHGATTAVNGSILLRTESMHRLSVDIGDRFARAEAGVRWSDLNAALSGTGLTGLPGSSGEVSVTGYTLGGGLSWFGRKYGVAANHVRAFELVDPGGDHVRITAQSDPDLFWALRGGGGDFGIVTALEIGLLPAEHIYGGRLVWSVDHAERVLETFTAIANTAPDELTVWAWLLNLPEAPFVPEPLRGRWSVVVDLTYLGPASHAEAHLAPLRSLAKPVLDTLGTVPLAAVGDIAAEPTEPTPLIHNSTLLTRFDSDGIAALIDAVAPGTSSALAVTEIRRLGGAFARVDDNHGAVGYFDAPYLLIYGGVPVLPEMGGAIADRVSRVQAAMMPYSNGLTPPSFAVTAEQAYPPDVLTRLSAIKQARDPYGVIRSNRPIPTGGGGDHHA